MAPGHPGVSASPAKGTWGWSWTSKRSTSPALVSESPAPGCLGQAVGWRKEFGRVKSLLGERRALGDMHALVLKLF